MTKRISSLMLSILLIASMVTDTFAAYMPRTKTPDYKVAFYAFDCYHMQDENGKRSGYGYEMMQGRTRHLHCRAQDARARAGICLLHASGHHLLHLHNKIIAGDYSTYDGIRVGLLRRHTYNGKFLDFVKKKGFLFEIVYYETPTELTNALSSTTRSTRWSTAISASPRMRRPLKISARRPITSWSAGRTPRSPSSSTTPSAA